MNIEDPQQGDPQQHLHRQPDPRRPAPPSQHRLSEVEYKKEEEVCTTAIEAQRQERTKPWVTWRTEFKTRTKSGCSTGWYLIRTTELAELTALAGRLPPPLQPQFLNLFQDKQHFYLTSQQGELLTRLMQQSITVNDARYLAMNKKSSMLTIPYKSWVQVNSQMTDSPTEEIKQAFAALIDQSFSYIISKDHLAELVNRLGPSDDDLRAELQSIRGNPYDVKIDGERKRQLMSSLRAGGVADLAVYEEALKNCSWVYYTSNDKAGTAKMIDSIFIENEPWLMPEMLHLVALRRMAPTSMDIEPPTNGQAH